MKTFADFKNEKKHLVTCFDELIETATKFNMDGQIDILQHWKEKILNGSFLLIVTGDFSRGKSTLINALLGEEVLPAKLVPTTGTINTIKYGPDPKAVAVFKDKTKGEKELSYQEFRELVSIDHGKEESDESLISFMNNPVKKVELFYPLDLCKNGVEIVDTPGLNDAPGRTDLTCSYIPYADAAIITLSAEEPLAQNEIDYIRELSDSGLKNFFFVVNFWDQVNNDDDSEEDRIKNDISSTLADVIGGSRLRISFLSSRQALRAKIKGDQTALEKSGFLGFEQKLGKFLIEERGQIFLEEAERVLDENCRLVESNIAQQEQLLKKSVEELEKMNATIEPQLVELTQRRDKIMKILEVNASRIKEDWVYEFDIMLDRLAKVHIKNDSKNWASDQKVLLLRGQFKKCTENFVLQADQYIHKSITDWINGTFKPQLKKEMDHLCNEIGDEAREILSTIDRINKTIDPNLQIRDYTKEDSVSVIERLMACGALIMFNPVAAGMGGIFGARAAMENFVYQFAGAMLLAFMGVLSVGSLLVVGIVIGIIQGGLQMKARQGQIRDNVVNKISDEIISKRSELSREFGKNIDQHFNSFGEVLASGIDTSINNIKSQLEKVIEEKNAKDRDLEKNLGELSVQASAVKNIRQNINVISV